VRADIERAIRDERIDPETEKMLARLRTQAVIEWKDDGFRQMYEKQLTAEAAAPPTAGAPAPANSPAVPSAPVSPAAAPPAAP
jgi:hypothetical protein